MSLIALGTVALDNIKTASGMKSKLMGGSAAHFAMSARLFTEVRERRGLCYSVYASYHTVRDHGGVFCYAATSADRAQETLDVTLRELLRLARDEKNRDYLDQLYYTLGNIEQQEGNTEKAVEQWKKAKELGSDSKTLNKKIRRKEYIKEYRRE